MHVCDCRFTYNLCTSPTPNISLNNIIMLRLLIHARVQKYFLIPYWIGAAGGLMFIEAIKVRHEIQVHLLWSQSWVRYGYFFLWPRKLVLCRNDRKRFRTSEKYAPIPSFFILSKWPHGIRLYFQRLLDCEICFSRMIVWNGQETWSVSTVANIQTINDWKTVERISCGEIVSIMLIVASREGGS